MPIIPVIGRKSQKMRALIWGLYAVLSLGGVTMVFPFMLMLGVSVSSDYEAEYFPLLPAYLYSDHALFGKYIYEKLPLEQLAWEYHKLDADFPDAAKELCAWSEKRDIVAPWPLAGWLDGDKTTVPSLKQARQQTTDFDAFRRDLPSIWRYAYFIEYKARFDNYARYQSWLADTGITLKYISTAWGTPVNSFDMVFPPGEDHWRRSFWPTDDESARYWARFKAKKLEPKYVQPPSINYAYWYYLKRCPKTPESESNIANATDYNMIFAPAPGAAATKFSEIVFPRQRPGCGDCYATQVWDTFMRKWLPVIMSKYQPPETEQPAFVSAYRQYLRDKFKTLGYYNEAHPDGRVRDFDEVIAPATPPLTLSERKDWLEFREAKRSQLRAGSVAEATDDGDYYCRIGWIGVDAPEYRLQDYLKAIYKNELQALNDAWGTEYHTWQEVSFPTTIADQVHFMTDKGRIRKSFFLGNYKDVVRFMITHGRAAVNTLILVAASILAALTVNPMAAYALSRFRLKHTNKILLFLLATMAFPAEVGMIPQFLLLKNLHMLNTYWALILPGLANGFGIFLLKGFFDSLPPELFEAAIMDGASEWRMFFNITLPLSKPILAVIALGAFGAAYGSFMFAFLVCQDTSKWTVMVFLYELQQYAPPGVVMASLVLSSLPTLLVFIFCQNIILRGIILPSFK